MERDYSISWIRLIATVSIIVCHVFQFYNNDLCAWFNVGVPLFFIISGYLYGSKSIVLHRGGGNRIHKKEFQEDPPSVLDFSNVRSCVLYVLPG